MMDATLLAARYAAMLNLPAEQADAVVRRSLAAGSDARAAMTALHAALSDGAADARAPALGSVRRRLELGYGEGKALPVVTPDMQHRERLHATPPMSRASMAPSAWRARWKNAKAKTGVAPAPRGAWTHAANRRRMALASLVLAQTWLATDVMSNVLPYHGQQPLEIGILVLFGILFGWISMGFWTALAGFAVLMMGGDRHAISRTVGRDVPPSAIAPDARTAIVMPICNESVPRVFAGLRATYESLAATGALDRYDFFILSDSSDADLRIAELDGWLRMCRAVDGYDRIFYRWRANRIKRKSGNIADFCRRWGRKYRYMIVLDADSVMSGECLTRLTLLAEANPGAGIIQTAPRAAGRDTLYARVQQFATGTYGPLFTAGLHFWQLGESHYWGHNAIIRVAPFMKHCALGRLPGRGALSGEILSHDFVEAALMRRAGWNVWIAYDLAGSYEEMPPNLIDELARDRRWCQGNLMNLRLFLMQGLHPAHRAVFMTGVMAYLSAPLWFAFLILSTALLAVHTLADPEYFLHPYQLFPLWPEWRPEWAASLFSATAFLLFLPKVLAGIRLAAGAGHRLGGRTRVLLSVLGESVMSALLAPIRMLFHTRFVVTALAGRSVRWNSPPRADSQTGWREALRRHGLHTVMGIAWATGVWSLDSDYLWWMLPVVGALIFSIPISVYTSRVAPGRRLRRRKYFLIPEEARPPAVLRATRRYLKRATAVAADFEHAVVDPVLNALACANRNARELPETARFERLRLTDRALRDGASALSAGERNVLLNDPVALSRLHLLVWCSDAAHARWKELRDGVPVSSFWPRGPQLAVDVAVAPAA